MNWLMWICHRCVTVMLMTLALPSLGFGQDLVLETSACFVFEGPGLNSPTLRAVSHSDRANGATPSVFSYDATGACTGSLIATQLQVVPVGLIVYHDASVGPRAEWKSNALEVAIFGEPVGDAHAALHPAGSVPSAGDECYALGGSRTANDPAVESNWVAGNLARGEPWTEAIPWQPALGRRSSDCIGCGRGDLRAADLNGNAEIGASKDASTRDATALHGDPAAGTVTGATLGKFDTNGISTAAATGRGPAARTGVASDNRAGSVCTFPQRAPGTKGAVVQGP